ncbi:DeoR/GlpR family DNA-binding transcription regulator [uncultured Cetobacterium sp.]|uniref:DeoR/GlpR family DNA-binding transcription regulator n=1 Tax=uncultured Cetobacterium sp. TaxID=527638 RepID=UPI002627F87A|nr:DeoR/GlpR family DNA-binding transcription regulator [uncultured Cetobacterium sp.]
MLATDRHNIILDLLSKERSIKNTELVKILNVSLETIRRDLDTLSKEGLLQKVHGGATHNTKIVETPYSTRAFNNISEKIELAKIAVKYIGEGDTIALNSSTTNLEIVKLIKEKNISVTLLTNSLLIANEIYNCDNINLILAGGIYSKKEFAFLGQVTADFLKQFTVNKCFLSVGGISLKKGITDFYIDEVLVEKQLIDISEEIIIVSDSSKFENNSLFNVCELNKINFLITDSNLNPTIKDEYLNNGINIINL